MSISSPTRSARMMRPIATGITAGILVVLLITPGAAQTNSLRLGTATVSPSTPSSVNLVVDALAAEPIGGVSFGVSLPVGLTFDDFAGPVADFVGVLSGSDFVAVGILFSTTSLEVRGPGFLALGTLSLSTPSLAQGTAVEIPLVGGLGSPPVPLEFSTVTGPVVPITLSGGVVAATPPASQVWIVSDSTDEVQSVDSEGTVGVTIPSGGALDPHAVAVDANGFAWVTYRGSDLVRRFDSSGTEVFVFGTSSTIATGAGPEGIAIDRFGNAWIANALDSTVSRVGAFGRVIFGGDGPPLDSPEDGVLGAAVPLSSPPRALAGDPAGSVWVVGSDGVAVGSVARINRSGLVAFEIALGADDPVDVAVDRLGLGWIVLRGGDRVERRASDGAVFASYAVAEPSAIALRRTPTGREAWVVGTSGGVDSLFRLQTDGTIDEFASPSAESIQGITVDGAGRPWIALADGTLLRLDPDSAPPAAPAVTATVASLADAEILGDATGYTQASVFYPDGDPQLLSFFDFDGDAFVNQLELQIGTDVFDASSTPAVDVAPVQGLACGSAAGTVTLTWSNAQAYDELQVLVNGALETTLSGSAEGTSIVLDAGVYDLEVVATIGADSSDPAPCGVVVGPGEVLGSTEVVSAGDTVNPFDVAVTNLTGPCVPAYLVTDPEARRVYCLDEDFATLDFFSSDLFGGDFGAHGIAYDPSGDGGNGSIFLAGGRQGEQVEIIEVDMEGQSFTSSAVLAIEDALGFPVEGRPGSLALRGNLGGETILLFSEPDFCEIFAVTASGTGTVLPDASFTHPSMFAGFGLNGLTITGDYSESGGTVWLTSGTGTEGEYEIGEFSISSGIATPTGSSVSLQNVSDENVLGGFGFVENAAEERFELSVIGITTSSVYELTASPLFIRGDANGDGVVDIGDPIAILGVLFSGEDPATCSAALDSNDDGGLDIADAIYVLSFLFSGGPAPAEPYPDPGGAPFECS